MTTSSTGDAAPGGATPPAQDQQPTKDPQQPGSTAASVDSGTPRLQMTGIAKRFGAVRAIRHADMTVDVGRVLALVGENGAGKSTLDQGPVRRRHRGLGDYRVRGPAGFDRINI